jgi:hypothetical protein
VGSDVEIGCEVETDSGFVARFEVVTAVVMRQEHADEIRDVELLHCETNGGRSVVAVLIVFV